MNNISSFQECESLSIERDKFPTKLESGNPFLMSQSFEFLSSDPMSIDFAIQENLNKYNPDELIANFMDRQIELSAQRIERIPRNVQALNNLGVSYLNNGKYDYALHWFTEALKLDAKFIPSLSNLARIHVLQGNLKKALSIYKTLEELNPSNVSILNNIGCILVAEKNFNKANEYFNKAIKINENDAHALNNIGLILLIEGKINKAINFFRRAIRAKIDLASAYNNMGLCYSFKKDYKRAIRHFLSSLSYNKFDVGTLLNLSQAHQFRNEHKEAIRVLTEFLESGHDDNRVSEYLAWSYFSLKDYQKALRLLVNLSKNEQLDEHGKASVLNNTAIVYQCLKNYDQAEKFFKLCLSLESSRSPLFFQNTIKFYFDRNKCDDAKALIDQGLIEYPNELGLLECLGRYYYEIGDYENASEKLNYIISKKPDTIEAYAILSVIEMEVRNDTRKAHDILTKALSFSRDNVGLLNNLAYNHLLEGNTVEARKILDTINAPDNIFINATRGLLLIMEGNLQEGRHLYNMAESLASQDKMFKNLIKQKKYLELAKYYYKEGKIHESEQYLEKVLPLKAKYGYFREQAIKLLNEMV